MKFLNCLSKMKRRVGKQSRGANLKVKLELNPQQMSHQADQIGFFQQDTASPIGGSLLYGHDGASPGSLAESTAYHQSPQLVHPREFANEESNQESASQKKQAASS